MVLVVVMMGGMGGLTELRDGKWTCVVVEARPVNGFCVFHDGMYIDGLGFCSELPCRYI